MRTTNYCDCADDGSHSAPKFSRWPAVLAIVALSACASGCTASYNSRNDSAPDSRVSVSCYIRGAFGQRYYKETDKKVLVRIYSHGPHDRDLLEQDLEKQREAGVAVSHRIPGLETQVRFEKEYRIRGSDIAWRSVWGSNNCLSLTFYDHGERAASDSPEVNPERPLRTIHFTRDPSTGEYSEQTSRLN
jgi:hypothetical protein